MRLPLHAQFSSRDGTLTKSPFLKNGYVLKDGDGMYVEKRPALRLYDALGATTGRGLIGFTDPVTSEETLFVLTGSTLSQYIDAVGSTLVNQSKLGAQYGTRYSFWLGGTDGDTNGDPRVLVTGYVRFGGLLWAVMGFNSTVTASTGAHASTDQSDRQFAYYSSDDGKTWEAAFDVAAGNSSYPTAGGMCVLVYNNKLWCLGGYNESATANREVWSSPDGVTWTKVTSAPSNWTSGNTAIRACVHNGKMYALVGTPAGQSASAYDGVCHSTDGITWTFTSNKPWTTTTPAANCSLGGMFSCGGNIIITQVPRTSGDHVAVYSTDDGDTWTNVAHTSWPDTALDEIGWLNFWKAGGTVWGIYISAVSSGTYTLKLAYTTDGTAYTDVSTLVTLQSVTIANSYALKYMWIGSAFVPLNPGCVTDDGVIVNTGWDPNAWSDGGLLHSPVTILSSASSPTAVSIGSIAGDKYDAQQVYDLTSVMIKSNVAGYVLDTVNYTLTQITDADYPPNTVRGLVYLNGIFYVMDSDGTIWGSAEDDPTTWTATNYVSAEFEPDGGVAIAKLDSYLVAFGTYTTEQFWDAGNATGSTLSPVTSTPLLMGCKNGDSVQECEGSLIWAAQAKGSGQGYLAGKFIAQFQGGSPIRISTPSVDKVIEADGLSDVDSCVVAKNGQTFYLLTLHTSGITIAYHLQAKRWYWWTQQTAGSSVSVSSITRSQDTATVTTSTAHGYSTGDLVEVAGANQSGYNKVAPITVSSTTVFTYLVDPSTTSPATGTITCQSPTAGEFTPAFSCNFLGMQLVLGADDGNVYEFDADTYEDNGEFVDFRMRTEKWDGQTDRGGGNMRAKFISEAEVVGDKISADAYLRWTDDDFQNWSSWRRIDCSLEQSRTHRLGTLFRRSHELLHTANTRARFEGLDLEAEEGD